MRARASSHTHKAGSLLLLAALSGLVAIEPVPAQSPETSVDPAAFEALRYRLIGPHRAGRVTAVAGVRTQPFTFYMGSTGGGVWKTEDAGQRWRNVSDGYFAAGSMGALAVADANPRVIYAGTGSSAIRGNVSAGDGMYKSTDAGETWRHVGLEDAGQIGEIVVHPDDPDLVYAAVLGHAFGPNDTRGVYRSQDGGDTWENVLFISENTGAVKLSMTPGRPAELYAAMWTARRGPWSLVSGSDESGIFKTVDGGDTWTELGGGLPEGVVGKADVTVSGGNPERVWVLIEHADGGVYRSDDAGASWRYLNDDQGLRARPWYYTHIHADPVDPNVVYVSSEDFWKSSDGGETFELVEVPHGDTHDLWINPDDNRMMIEANDGGANVSLNGGESWSTVMNQPTAEFYRVTVDNQFPYRVYGGQQDNSTLSLPSRTNTGAITIQHWYSVGGGESGHIAVDPRNPDIIYAGSYGGTLTRRDRAAQQTRNISIYPELAGGQAARDLRYRLQWNFPVRISPHDPDVVYVTSQHVHRSRDGGQSWEVISPDLTHDDPLVQDYSGGPVSRDNTGVEVFGTVFAFEESPHQPGLFWAGSDDGRVHVSRDGGATWTDITPPDLERFTTVNMIDLSAHDPGRAHVAAHRYRLDDFTPMIWRTDDYGQSWERIADGTRGIPSDHFTRVAREDPDRRGLLYAGTEFGMYVSFDDGERWQPFQLNLPITPVTDLAVHQQDLVVATQGRSFWILDDLTPLHQLHADVLAAAVHLFAPRAAYRWLEEGRGRGGNTNTFRDDYGGAAVDWERVGEDAPMGLQVFYTLTSPPGDIRLEFLETDGSPIRAFTGTDVPAELGMNRFAWDLRYPDAEIDGELFRGTSSGPKAVPGEYTVRLVVDGQSQSRTFRILKDPRIPATQADLVAQFDMLLEIRDAIEDAYGAIGEIRNVNAELASGGDTGLSDQQLEALSEIEQALIQDRIEYREDVWNFPSKLRHQIAYLASVVASTDAGPTDAAVERGGELRAELDALIARLEEMLNRPIVSEDDPIQE